MGQTPREGIKFFLNSIWYITSHAEYFNFLCCIFCQPDWRSQHSDNLLYILWAGLAQSAQRQFAVYFVSRTGAVSTATICCVFCEPDWRSQHSDNLLCILWAGLAQSAQRQFAVYFVSRTGAVSTATICCVFCEPDWRSQHSDNSKGWTVRGSNPRKNKTLFRNARTGPGPQPASHSMDIGIITRG